VRERESIQRVAEQLKENTSGEGGWKTVQEESRETDKQGRERRTNKEERERKRVVCFRVQQFKGETKKEGNTQEGKRDREEGNIYTIKKGMNEITTRWEDTRQKEKSVEKESTERERERERDTERERKRDTEGKSEGKKKHRKKAHRSHAVTATMSDEVFENQIFHSRVLPEQSSVHNRLLNDVLQSATQVTERERETERERKRKGEKREIKRKKREERKRREERA
jgi:hypothetical protein